VVFLVGCGGGSSVGMCVCVGGGLGVGSRGGGGGGSLYGGHFLDFVKGVGFWGGASFLVVFGFCFGACVWAPVFLILGLGGEWVGPLLEVERGGAGVLWVGVLWGR
jgi:hypothetical protein